MYAEADVYRKFIGGWGWYDKFRKNWHLSLLKIQKEPTKLKANEKFEDIKQDVNDFHDDVDERRNLIEAKI